MARVSADGKVTFLKCVRGFLGVCEGDCVRLGLMEVIKKKESGRDASKWKVGGG